MNAAQEISPEDRMGWPGLRMEDDRFGYTMDQASIVFWDGQVSQKAVVVRRSGNDWEVDSPFLPNRIWLLNDLRDAESFAKELAMKVANYYEAREAMHTIHSDHAKEV